MFSIGNQSVTYNSKFAILLSDSITNDHTKFQTHFTALELSTELPKFLQLVPKSAREVFNLRKFFKMTIFYQLMLSTCACLVNSDIRSKALLSNLDDNFSKIHPGFCFNTSIVKFTWRSRSFKSFLNILQDLICFVFTYIILS